MFNPVRRSKRFMYTFVQSSNEVSSEKAHYCPAKQEGLSAGGTLMPSQVKISQRMRHIIVQSSKEVSDSQYRRHTIVQPSKRRSAVGDEMEAIKAS